MVIVLAISLGLLLTKRRQLLASLRFIQESNECKSDACKHYSLRLGRTISATIDPCVDFHGFVCEGWIKRHAESVLAMACAEVVDSVSRNARTMAVPRRDQMPSQKAAGFYTSCTTVYDENRDELREMKAILREAGIFWPRVNTSSGDVLRAILYMAHNWPQGSIFVIERNRKKSLQIDVSGDFLALVQKRAARIDSQTYQTYFHILRDAYADTDEETVSYEEQLNLEARLLPTLVESLKSRDVDPITLNISDIGSLTPTISAQRWKKAVRRQFGMRTKHMKITVLHRDFFETFFHPMTGVNESQMMYVGWYAVQLCSMYVRRDLIVNHYGTRPIANVLHPMFCFNLTEKVMGPIFYAKHFDSLFNQTTRTNASHFTQTIETSVIRLMKRRKWITKDREAITRVSAWKHTFDYLNKADLLRPIEVVSKYPDMTARLIDNWKHVLANHKELVDSDSYVLHRHLGRPFRYYKDPPKLYLSPCTLNMPIYDPPMLESMKYGGLGSFFSSGFLELFDSRLRRQPEEKVADDVSGSDASDYQDESIPSADAFETASLDALWDAFSLAGDRSWLVVDDRSFSAAQLFFVMFCFVGCGDIENRQRCNKLLIRTTEFSRAFLCDIK